MKSLLHIKNLKLTVNLGWEEIERQHEQSILLDLKIVFATPPIACETDHLQDTVCYADLIQTLRKELATKKFHLIEHLTHEIYDLVKQKFPVDAMLSVNVTKHPNVEGLLGGVSFCFDETR